MRLRMLRLTTRSKSRLRLDRLTQTSLVKLTRNESVAVRSEDPSVSNEEGEEVIERNVYLAAQETEPNLAAVQRVIDAN
jgi:hypothetical protein